MLPATLCRWVVAAAAIEMSLAVSALAAPVGEAASVVPASNYTRNGAAERPLAIRDTLEQNDRITTTNGGSTRVRFLDDTMLTIGPNSEVLLDQFVFDGNRAQKATVEVVRGAMRFVSGTSDRRAYEIKTPAATIGVRGTVVDIGFVNGRWSFNPVDGTITATLTTTGETRTFNAGQPGFSIGPSGFTPLNPNDAAQLWRRLDGAHLALAKAAGTNPSAPQGAAAGNQGNADVTGSPGGQQGQQGQQGAPGGTGGPPAGGGPGTGAIGGPAYSSAPPVNITTTTGSPTGGAADGFPIFTTNLMSAMAVGGTASEVSFEIAPFLNRALTEKASLEFDTNGALKALTIKGTGLGVTDPNAGTLTRVTAIVADLYTDPSATTLYQIGRWTNGQITGSVNGNTIIDETLTPQQGLHYIIFGYTNGLYDTNNQIPFGKIVTYSLERATSPTWINAGTAPGTFSGTLAVAFGTMAVSYGLQAQLAMTEGTITMQTPGGITNPHLSGAIGSVVGGIYRSAYTAVTSTDGFCASTSCIGIVNFVPVSSNKIGIFYALGIDDSDIIEGAAVFGNPGTPTAHASAYAKPVGSFVDSVGIAHVAGNVQGVADVSGSTVRIRSFTDGLDHVTRTTAQSVDVGSHNFIGWERWTNGTYLVNGTTPVSVPANGGVHMIHGLGATMPFTPSGGPGTATSVQYSLAGGTFPTHSTGATAPGTLGTGSKIGLDFNSGKIGIDLFVNIGAANYQMSTTGGAATPSSSSLTFNSDGVFVGALNVTLPTGTAHAACTIGTCGGGVAGFLSDIEATAIGLTYSLGNSSANFISGAAAFGRVMPVSNIGAFGYADQSLPANDQMLIGKLADFNTSAGDANNLAIVPDSAKLATGLSVSAFDLEVSTPNYGWHRIAGSPNGSSVDQGVVAGVLGWERLIGTLHQHTSDGGGDPITLGANKGVHIIHGVAATNIPTNVTYTYDLAGGTLPTIADGSVAPGTILNTSKVGVNFSNTAPKFGVDLKVDMQTNGGAGQYNILSSGGATSPSLAAPNLHSNGTFGATGITTTNTSGTNTVCATSCSGSVNGFLAGDGAKNLGIVYQINSATAGKTVTGAAGFTKSP